MLIQCAMLPSTIALQNISPQIEAEIFTEAYLPLPDFRCHHLPLFVTTADSACY